MEDQKTTFQQPVYAQAPHDPAYAVPPPAAQPVPSNVYVMPQYVHGATAPIAAAPMPPAGPQYLSATPLAALNQGPAPVDCPACGQRHMTAVSPQIGSATHVWAAVFCFVFLLPCVPYLFSVFKDVSHRCSNCGTLLATWHRNGSTEVHYYAAGAR